MWSLMLCYFLNSVLTGKVLYYSVKQDITDFLMCVLHMSLLQILESNYLMTPLSGNLKYSEAFEMCGYLCVLVWASRNFPFFLYIFLGFFFIRLFFRHCISEKNVTNKQYKTIKNI